MASRAATVALVACDGAEAFETLQQVMVAAPPLGQPGVLHAAGLGDQGRLVDGVTAGQLARLLAPKAWAASPLHASTAAVPQANCLVLKGLSVHSSWTASRQVI